MNILFATLCDINSIDDRNIYTDLLREFIRNNHKVYIASPLEKRHKRNTELIIEGNSALLKIKIGNIQKTNVFEKGIYTILLEHKFKSAIKKYFPNVKFDLLLYSTPPITLVNVIKYIKKRDAAKTYLLLKDIFPQNAVDSEMFSRKSPIYNYFRAKEKSLYEISDHIGCMSQANVDYVVAHNSYIDVRKVEVCPNSIELFDIEKDFTNTEIIKNKYRIPFDKIIFLYGGNLGKPQGVDFIVECLKAVKSNSEAFFLIVGSGTEYAKLEKYKNENEQSNYLLLPYLPSDKYEILVNSCDVGLIFLDKRFTIPNFPSRLLAYMQAQIPVLAATDVNTDVGKVIVEGGFGWWCESSSAEEFAALVNIICKAKDNLSHMGKCAKKYLDDNYTVEKNYNTIIASVNLKIHR